MNEPQGRVQGDLPNASVLCMQNPHMSTVGSFHQGKVQAGKLLLVQTLRDELAGVTRCTSKQIYEVDRAMWSPEKNNTVRFMGSDEIF